MMDAFQKALRGNIDDITVDDIDPNDADTLLYLETCMVDHNGKFEAEKMNHEDFQNMKLFKLMDILDWEPLSPQQERQQSPRSGKTHQITKFTDRAWEIAHHFRKQRGELDK